MAKAKKQTKPAKKKKRVRLVKTLPGITDPLVCSPNDEGEQFLADN